MDKTSQIPRIPFYTGNSIPIIGYGTYQLRGDDCTNGVRIALETGYRHIDTASIYRNEEAIAAALGPILKSGKLKREDIFITSKIAPAQQGYDNAIKACKEILAKLDVEYLDLLIIHWPGVAGYKPEAIENSTIRLETWKALEKLKEDGLVKDIGVSNFMKRHLEHLLKHTKTVPVLNQFEIHPFCIEKETIDLCREKGIVVEAYSSLARNEDILMKNKLLLEIAGKYKKSVAQVALRWAIENKYVVLPKSKTEERIKENFDVFDFELTKEEIEKVNALNKRHHTCWDPNTIMH